MSECIYQREGWLVRLRRSPIRQEMLFERFGALGYLRRGYDVLHAMSEAWLVAELDGYLKARGFAA